MKCIAQMYVLWLGNSSAMSFTTTTKYERFIVLSFHDELNTLSPNNITEIKDLHNHVMLNTTADDNGGDSTCSSEYEIALHVLGMLPFFSDIINNWKASSVVNTTIKDYIYALLCNTLFPGVNMVEAVICIGEVIIHSTESRIGIRIGLHMVILLVFILINKNEEMMIIDLSDEQKMKNNEKALAEEKNYH